MEKKREEEEEGEHIIRETEQTLRTKLYRDQDRNSRDNTLAIASMRALTFCKLPSTTLVPLN
jgi:hypothetical protein